MRICGMKLSDYFTPHASLAGMWGLRKFPIIIATQEYKFKLTKSNN